MSSNYVNRSQDSTSHQIENQLAEGRSLLELEIRSSKELERAAARRSIWVENNVKLLKGCSLPEDTKSKLLMQVGIDSTDTGGDFDAEVHSFYDITKTQMSVLESALALISKSPEHKLALNENAESAFSPIRVPSSSINGTARLDNVSLKERLERHPLGVAATICFGCITIVFIVMNWYHNENEKRLIYKYETQMNGMKNDYEAQRRNHEEVIRDYEETIRKLNEELSKTRPADDRQNKR